MQARVCQRDDLVHAGQVGAGAGECVAQLRFDLLGLSRGALVRLRHRRRVNDG